MTEPRLLIGGGRLDRLRTEIRDVRAAQFRRLLDQCEFYAGESPPEEHPEASITYLGPASAGFALAYRLTDQPQYLEQARRWIAAAVSYPHWGRAHMPDHDLDAGWLLHGLGLAYDWLGDALPAAERSALREKLILQGDRLYRFAVESEGTWWSSSYWQNHNWICYAGVLTAGYALRDEHPPAKDWTARALDNFRTVADMLPADGSGSEGVVYWRYGVPSLAIAFELIEEQDGVDLFETCAFLRNTFSYRLHQSAPGWEYIVDHGDCHDRRSGHSLALYHKLAGVYRLGEAQWLAERVRTGFLGREWHESGVKPGVRAEGYLELLWYDPTVPAEAPEQLPTSAYFPDLGLVTARTGWDDDAVLLSFKASPGGGHRAWESSHRMRDERGWDTLNAGHHHPDANTFVLIGHGSPLAVEDGYANNKLTRNHNVVLVDGTGYAGEDRYHVYKDMPLPHQAHVHSVRTAEGWVHAVGETAAMYPAELGVLRVSRRILFGPSGSLLVIDDLAADGERTWTWLLHADQPATAKAGGGMLVRSGTGALTVHALPSLEIGQSEFGQSDIGQSEFGQSETLVTANPTSSTPSLVVGRRLHTLRREVGPARSARFVSLLLPGSALEPTPDDQVSGTADEISWRHGDWDYRVGLGGTDVEATARSGGAVRRIRASATEE
ncbi:MAG TPA: DUF4962 domain-containing protein [Pseudonocardia sp.]|nr:DUF4962 domain-containing protein [Pseudonocardia sp.]